jgi:hypothetical protein
MLTTSLGIKSVKVCFICMHFIKLPLLSQGFYLLVSVFCLFIVNFRECLVCYLHCFTFYCVLSDSSKQLYMRALHSEVFFVKHLGHLSLLGDLTFCSWSASVEFCLLTNEHF